MVFAKSQILFESFYVYHISLNTYSNPFIIPIIKMRKLKHKGFDGNLSRIPSKPGISAQAAESML